MRKPLHRGRAFGPGRRGPTRALVALALVVTTPACSDRVPEGASAVLEVWAHAGRQSERETLELQIERFNRSRDDLRAELTFLPEGSYDGQVQAAALAGDLPDLLEFDGPYLYNYAWQGKLVELGPLLSDSLRAELLPSILEQGTYEGGLYSVGTFDSGLGLWGRRSRLEAVGARIPLSPGEAWSVAEFEQVLDALASRDGDGAVLDLKLDQRGEWLTYGFSPPMYSAGGGLVELEGAPHAGGVLDGAASTFAVRAIQGWIEDGRVDPNLDAAAFTSGRVSLSWSGHWDYPGYAEAFGEDLLLLPLPDFGEGTRTGQGSWNWGITTSCADPERAMELLEFLLRPEEVLAMTRANGAVPATSTAIGGSELYAEGGPLHLFVRQLREGFAVPRPRTPAYPIVSSAFQDAFRDVRHGRDAKAALHEAAALIDRDLRDNHGYPPQDSLAKTEGAGP